MIGKARPALAFAVLLLAPAGLPAQETESPKAERPSADGAPVVTLVPGPRYDAGALREAMLGRNRRGLWLTPLTVPVLDLSRYAGGLEPIEPGGSQTRTLHFHGADGRRRIFRSVDKHVGRTLPAELRRTVVEDVLQDYTAALHPAGALVVPPLHRALGLLSDDPALFVMPDDPLLGPFRATFAGMLGQMVERPEAGPDGEPGWGGFDRVIGTDELFDLLAADARHRVDAGEVLASRLIDFLVGDPDRGRDQWRWARVAEPDGIRWRPIARDRDWAFIHADGLVARVARLVYPKLLRFGPELPDLEGLTGSDGGIDRRLLTPLDREEFMAVARSVRDRLTDAVLDSAVARLPEAMRPDHAASLATSLRARRDAIPALAAVFYDRLALAPDIRGTAAGDRAEIQRHPDGAVTVMLFTLTVEEDPMVLDHRPATAPAASPLAAPTRGAAAPAVGSPEAWPPSGTQPWAAEVDEWRQYYSRHFRPAETEEVRLYLDAGDDVAVVRGRGRHGGGDVTVRIIGGAGADHLVDAATGGPTVFYDAGASDWLEPGPDTRVDRDPFRPSPPLEDWLTHELGGDGTRDEGSELSWLVPALDYGEGAGVVVGAGPGWTGYGFRRRPHAAELDARLLFATGSGGWGLALGAERRLESSPVSLRLDARATDFDAVRFYGFGNDAPVVTDHDRALVMQRRVSVEPALVVERRGWRVAGGPVFAWTDPEPRSQSAAEREAPFGSDAFTQVGARLAAASDRVDHAAVPTRGLRFRAATGIFASPGAADGGFGRVDVEGRGYAPLPLGATLALRLGGQHAWGTFPIQEAARIGGGATLRGYRWQRFAGDAAAYGGAELRVPLFRAELLVRGRLGALALADAGRVWHGSRSAGGWHTGYGAGLWFASLGRAVSVVWARGEEDRVYLALGMPF